MQRFHAVACLSLLFLLDTTGVPPAVSSATAAELRPGQMLVVSRRCDLRVKEKVLARLDAGTELRLEEINGPWLWVVVEPERRVLRSWDPTEAEIMADEAETWQLRGWIRKSNVVPGRSGDYWWVHLLNAKQLSLVAHRAKAAMHNGTVGRDTVELIAHLPAAQAVPLLYESLTSGNPASSHAAAVALGRCGPSGLKALRRALQHEQASIRRDAVLVLMQYDARSVPESALNELLDDPDIGLQNARNMMVPQPDTPQAMLVLFRALRHEGGSGALGIATRALSRLDATQLSPDVREMLKTNGRAIAEALVQLGEWQPGANIDVQVHRAARNKLFELGDSATVYDHLLKIVENKDRLPEDRAQAALILRAAKDPQVQSALGSMFADDSEDYRVRQAAAAALGDSQAVATLCDWLKVHRGILSSFRTKPAYEREGAALALGKAGDANALPALIEALNDSEYSVRLAAAKALGELGHQGAEPALQKLAAITDLDVPPGSDGDLRYEAAQALLKLRDPTSVSVLQKSLKAENPRLRLAAAETLAGLDDLQTVPALREAAQDAESSVRLVAFEALAKLAPSALSVQNLKELLEHSQSVSSCREAVAALGSMSDNAQALSVLCDTLQSEMHSLVRRDVVKALEAKGGSQAVSSLLAVIDTDDYLVRLVAVEALGNLGGQHVTSALQKALETDSPYLPWGDEAERSEKYRQIIAENLVKLGDPEELLTHRDYRVRGVAAATLGKDLPNLGEFLADESVSGKCALYHLLNHGWRPGGTDADLVHLVLAEESEDLLDVFWPEIISHWAEVKRVLVTDLRRASTAAEASCVLIRIGRQEVVDDMIASLRQYGTYQMAEWYLNSGHTRLADAARTWANTHDVQIKNSPYPNLDAPKWGGN